jgi:hypothetical protein
MSYSSLRMAAIYSLGGLKRHVVLHALSSLGLKSFSLVCSLLKPLKASELFKVLFHRSENEPQLIWLRHAAGMQATGVQTLGSALAHRDLSHLPRDLSHLPVVLQLSIRWMCPHCTDTWFEH